MEERKRPDASLGPFCRPGGLSLTRLALEAAQFAMHARLVDVGCGQGGTLRYLAEHTSFQAVGVEREPAFCDGRTILQGDARSLPFAAGSFDGALLECSLSRMEEPEKVLAEVFRILKPGGKLCVSDMTCQTEEQRFDGALGRLERRSTQEQRFREARFVLTFFYDASEELKEFWGQLLLDGRGCELPQLLGADRAALRRCRCGYGVWILQKE